MRKEQTKNYRFVPFIPDACQKIPKNSKKNLKIRQYHDGSISSQNRLKEDEKERK